MADRIIASGDAHSIPPQEGCHIDRIAPNRAKAAAKLREVQAMALDTFDQVEALVKLSLLAMETPAGASTKTSESFAQMLLVIRGLVQETRGAIETEACDAIEPYFDGGQRRRYAASAASRSCAAAGATGGAR